MELHAIEVPIHQIDDVARPVMVRAKSVPGRLAEAGFTSLANVAASTGAVLGVGMAIGLLVVGVLWQGMGTLRTDATVVVSVAIGATLRAMWDRFWSSNFIHAYRLFHDAPELTQSVGYRKLHSRETEMLQNIMAHDVPGVFNKLAGPDRLLSFPEFTTALHRLKLDLSTDEIGPQSTHAHIRYHHFHRHMLFAVRPPLFPPSPARPLPPLPSSHASHSHWRRLFVCSSARALAAAMTTRWRAAQAACGRSWSRRSPPPPSDQFRHRSQLLQPQRARGHSVRRRRLRRQRRPRRRRA